MRGNVHVRFGGGQREKQVKLLALCLPYWLAPHIARIARLLQEAREQDVSVVFWDHDHVEAKNIFRQNFCEAEIGVNKALALAQRYGFAWGIPITAIDKPFDKNIASKNDLVVWAVSNLT